MRNAACVFMGALLATAVACSGDDDEGDGDNPYDNPGAGASGIGGGSSGVNGGAANGSAANGGGLSSGCADGIVRTSRVTPRVILLLDGSCSMSTDYPSNDGMSSTRCDENGNSRWAALRNALLDPNQGVVTRLAGAVEFGLLVYGTQPSCPLTHDPILPALDNLGPIENALGNRPPGMYTPTGAAMDHVYRNLIEPSRPDSDMGKQIVVLATDGEPNSCDQPEPDYGPSLQAAELGKSMLITTYVISLANAQGEFHDHLQQLANLGAGFDAQGGQVAKLYEPSTPEQLAADLELLIGGAVGCDIALNGDVDPNRACEGEITLNDQPLPCNDSNGWTLIDSRHIRIEGAACEELKNNMSAVVRADFDCTIFDPQ
jgi:hypothetical protein